MSKTANFQVDPRLAALLGETYRSTEQAIKELVDNAWDADAETVVITLPSLMSPESIVIEDDGSGMTETELLNEYLKVARDRRSTKGAKTFLRKRPVKGRKGIGKFAGLMAADVMQLETSARGQFTRLTIPKKELLEAEGDFEYFQLPYESNECDDKLHGTRINLTSLNQHLSFPDAERLKQLLVLEYGREENFKILVNGSPLDIDHLPGKPHSEEVTHEQVGPIRMRLRIAEGKQTFKNSGVVIRVGSKVIGKPSFLGLENDEEIPKGFLKKVYCEIEADGLADEVTADWGAVIENSLGKQFIDQWAAPIIKQQLASSFQNHFNLVKARLQKEIDKRLSRLPEHRRQYAEKALEKLMEKLYWESEERIKPVVSVMLDAFERDEYWFVLQRIDDARHADVEALAEALLDFGVLELSVLGQQALRRKQFLDDLQVLVNSPETLEMTMHKALEKNLWVFGPDFALLASNKTLADTIERYTAEEFTGKRAKKRPDLLLLGGMRQHYCLIEFKRPNHTIDRDDENQAEKYRDDLFPRFNPMDIVLVGGGIDRKVLLNKQKDVSYLSYEQVISRARAELDWLLQNLTTLVR